jgi:ubiquinone/menaquinone biosynthesis C-methylase UbiE
MARYDGHTEWYAEFASTEPFQMLRASVVARLGQGPGRCIDVGCGTGFAIPLLLDAGWDVTAIDPSADQLAAIPDYDAELVQADAHKLPFSDGAFDAAVSILTHSDFDDAGAVFREIARVLQPGAPFVYGGVHPAFGAPHAQPLEDGTTLLQPRYRKTGWHTVSRDPEKPGISSRVGFNHITLSTLFTSLVDAGFTVTRFDEPGERDPPLFLVLSARRTT